MDSLNELKRLVSDACDALNAAADILSDESLPVAARLKAYDRCLESHDKIRTRIADLSTLLKAEIAAHEMLMTYQIPEKREYVIREATSVQPSLFPMPLDQIVGGDSLSAVE